MRAKALVVALMVLIGACIALQGRGAPSPADVVIQLPPRVDVAAVFIRRWVVDSLEKLAEGSEVELFRCLLGRKSPSSYIRPDTLYVDGFGEVAIDSAASFRVAPAQPCIAVYAGVLGHWHSHVNRALSPRTGQIISQLTLERARESCEMSQEDARDVWRFQMISVRRGVSCAFWVPAPMVPIEPPNRPGGAGRYHYERVWTSWESGA